MAAFVAAPQRSCSRSWRAQSAERVAADDREEGSASDGEPGANPEVALALPEAVEVDHHGFPSFRVRGKVFATLPDAAQLNAMIDPDEVAAVVALAPEVCAELWWGKRLCG